MRARITPDQEPAAYSPRGGLPAPETERGFLSSPVHANRGRERWLIPTDGLDESLCTIDHVARICGRIERDIHLLHVQEPMTDWQVRKYYTERDCKAWLDGRSENALREACAILDRANLSYGCHVEAGEVPATIAGIARNLACDAIVFGIQRISVSQLIFGRAIAFQVARQTTVPLLLVPLLPGTGES
jgi:nucleotide-binding universal stress UspA family protein